MVKYDKKTFSIDEAEEEEMPLQKIARLIAQEYDNEIAKAFTFHISKLLKDNGIVPIMTKHPMDVSTITDTATYKMVTSFGISFNELDTSEHDAKVRADEREKVLKEVIETLGNDYWTIAKIQGLREEQENG